MTEATSKHSRVSLADDDGEMREYLRALLARFGFTVLGAVEGEDTTSPPNQPSAITARR